MAFSEKSGTEAIFLAAFVILVYVISPLVGVSNHITANIFEGASLLGMNIGVFLDWWFSMLMVTLVSTFTYMAVLDAILNRKP